MLTSMLLAGWLLMTTIAGEGTLSPPQGPFAKESQCFAHLANLKLAYLIAKEHGAWTKRTDAGGREPRGEATYTCRFEASATPMAPPVTPREYTIGKDGVMRYPPEAGH